MRQPSHHYVKIVDRKRETDYFKLCLEYSPYVIIKQFAYFTKKCI